MATSANESDGPIDDSIVMTDKEATGPNVQVPGSETARDDGVATFDATEAPWEASIRSSLSHWDPEPGFAHVDGEIGGSGYNETKTDIIAIPCPGASPVETWMREPLPDGYFGHPTNRELDSHPALKEFSGRTILSPAINRALPKAKHLWIRQGIRREANTARVMLYRHRELREGLTLDDLAEDLLDQLHKTRDLSKNRPLFFICHSIGGLVAKLALAKASEREDMRWLIFHTHGMTFFATPHLGSSYLSMPNLRESIQHLLHLSQPWPRSITEELRLNHKQLLRIHDVFRDIASEMRIWTFYETKDSQLSGLGSSDFDEVHFSAPLASIKSSLLSSTHEQPYSLDCTHADCASFGPDHLRIMHAYLLDLAEAVAKAQSISFQTAHHPLRLGQSIKLELIGFYEDPDPVSTNDMRLYVSKHHLDEFLDKGPERCLQERLNAVAAKQHYRPQTLTSAANDSIRSGALGIRNMVEGFFGTLPRPRSSQLHLTDHEGRASPEIVVTSHASGTPSVTDTSAQSVPSAAPKRARELTVPSLSTPGYRRPSSRSSSQSRRERPRSDEVHRTSFDPTSVGISPRTILSQQEPEPSGEERVHLSEVEIQDSSVHGRDQEHQVDHATALNDLTAGFSRPNPKKRKFMWIHLPFNNPYWVKSIFNKLAESQHQTYSRLLRNENWVDRHVRGRHAQAHSSYVRPGCNYITSESHSPRPSSPSISGRSNPGSPIPSHLYLYLPYLHFDTYKNVIKRRKTIRRRLGIGRARPVPKDIADEESLETRVTWEYIGHDPPLHPRRTLDQYGYPSLRDTYARDDDQMLYKLTKERAALTKNKKRHLIGDALTATSPAGRLAMFTNRIKKADAMLTDDESQSSDDEDEILDGNLLMVDQLWLWAVDMTTLTTFFPKRESHPSEGPMFQQADLRNSVYNELNGDLTGRCDNALDLAAFTALHAITVLLDRTSHRDLEVFRIFEEALGVLTERMTFSLKRFRMQSFRDRIADEPGSSSELEDNRTKSIKKRHKREIEQSERENRHNTSALLELRDMDDELTTMESLFQEQKAALVHMQEIYHRPELRSQTVHGRAYLDEALTRLDEYGQQVGGMRHRIEATRNDYEKLLEMVQRQAQVDEVRWSRLQTELASTQNLSVMIFTTFTVIFLPLSFFTSLFGMNTQEWGGPDDNDFVSLRTIGAISLPASALVVGLSLVAAFSSRVQAAFKYLFRHARSGVEKTKYQFGRMLLPHVSMEAKQRRAKAKEGCEKDLRRKKEVEYDFWETLIITGHRDGNVDPDEAGCNEDAAFQEREERHAEVARDGRGGQEDHGEHGDDAHAGAVVLGVARDVGAGLAVLLRDKVEEQIHRDVLARLLAGQPPPLRRQRLVQVRERVAQAASRKGRRRRQSERLRAAALAVRGGHGTHLGAAPEGVGVLGDLVQPLRHVLQAGAAKRRLGVLTHDAQDVVQPLAELGDRLDVEWVPDLGQDGRCLVIRPAGKTFREPLLGSRHPIFLFSAFILSARNDVRGGEAIQIVGQPH
ncbi:hypothetical protein PG994_014025 [Apiospora phragmitis]|uniref:DUF676 domain-containing protein n=1 Tax=Apiospora phragmitis TaxID=2905665 RepID=A0ABR1T359_9PEZI